MIPMSTLATRVPSGPGLAERSDPPIPIRLGSCGQPAASVYCKANFEGREGMASDDIFVNVRPENFVYRDEDGIVILDDPIRPGHVLVGCRSAGASLSDVSEEDAAALMRLASRVAKHIVRVTGAEKVYVAAIGDKDKHFHVHLLPKMKGDPNLGPHVFGEKGWIQFLPASPDTSAVEAVTAQLRAALSPKN